MQIKAKHAEEKLDILDSVIKQMRATLKEARAKSKEPNSQMLKDREVMILKLEEAYIACMDLVKEHATVINDNARFVETIREAVLKENDVVPVEMFSEQAQILEDALKPLIQRYNSTVTDYYTRKKGT